MVITNSTVARDISDRSPKRSRAAEQVAVLFQEHANFTWRALLQLGVPEADAEDALQEVFVIVASKLEQYQERGAMRAWLFAIARQVAHHVRRDGMRRDRRKDVFPAPQPSDDPQREAEQREAIELMSGFLEQLEDSQAQVFYLAEIEEMTAPEIAAALDVNLTTVYGRLRLARKRFDALVRDVSGQGV
jgi:RNA polymerase sigma-70 factor (ECF subfamily)